MCIINKYNIYRKVFPNNFPHNTHNIGKNIYTFIFHLKKFITNNIINSYFATVDLKITLREKHSFNYGEHFKENIITFSSGSI